MTNCNVIHILEHETTLSFFYELDYYPQTNGMCFNQTYNFWDGISSHKLL